MKEITSPSKACPISVWKRALFSLRGIIELLNLDVDGFIDDKVIFGDSVELTPNHHNKNKALVLPDGTIFALKKPSPGGDLKSLGATGVNNYNSLWYTADLYN